MVDLKGDNDMVVNNLEKINLDVKEVGRRVGAMLVGESNFRWSRVVVSGGG